jgi:chromosome transmission fidelity protein 1
MFHNFRCTDMQHQKQGRSTATDSLGKAVKKSRATTGCSYFQQRAVERLRDEALLEVQDVEQLVTLGRKLSACPYYASRAAVGDAQVCICIRVYCGNFWAELLVNPLAPELFF